MSRAALLAPPLCVAAGLGALALLLDHGLRLGLGMAALEATGRAYFLLLLFAPLVVYPLVWRAGASFPLRLALSLLPGFLWWLTEIPVRLRWNTPPEALWLAASPLNLAHLYVSCVAVAVADLGCRGVGALRGRSGVRPRPRHVVLGVACLVLAPALVIGWIFPFLLGFQALFQAGLLPMPRALPGPLPPGAVEQARPVPHPPNVVFILSDDHRFDFTGYEGHPFVRTPSLDRLAAEGVRFSRAYVTSSLCSPSRASFLTGTWPHRHGVWNNFTPWSDENRTFLEHLSRAGYATAFIGKWHMPGGLPELRGVDHFVTFTNMGGQGVYEWCPLVVDGREEESRTRYIATELTDRALAWMEENAERPFALYLSHKSVHADFTPDEPDRGRYATSSVELPEGAHPWTHLTNAQYVHLSFRPLGTVIRSYAEAITSLDREIGRVLDFLEERGLRENTLVIYTSDNGYFWGERGLVDKRWPYETSIRVPFLLRYPASGHAPGVTADGIVAGVDVAPTLLDLAGLSVPERMQGQSLRPLLSDPSARVRDELLYAYYLEPPYPTPTSQAIVTTSHKLIRYDGLPDEVYDLGADPHERRNLGMGSPQAEALSNRLDRLLAGVGD
ncbi:MAG: sulfatase [Myxococcota bacterium]|nr:sulfatase [Myxococcota bacterium]